jgi:hypothetical protein
MGVLLFISGPVFFFGLFFLPVGDQVEDVPFPETPATPDSISRNGSLVGQSVNGFYVNSEKPCDLRRG